MNNNNQRNCSRSNMNHNCQCIDQMSLAMAYVPWQTWNNVYEPAKGMQMGTIFGDLYLPFQGKRGATKW